MRRGWFLPIAAALGFSFLYAPIVSLVIFSFNESRLVTVWSGFSTKWYGELFRDPQMLGAAWLSLQIAAIAATIALVLGTLAAATMKMVAISVRPKKLDCTFRPMRMMPRRRTHSPVKRRPAA